MSSQDHRDPALPDQRRLPHWFAYAAASVVITVGLATVVTVWILGSRWDADHELFSATALVRHLFFATILLSMNILLRFARWYLLLRGIGLRVSERLAFQVYGASLAFNFTPFAIGPTLYRIFALNASSSNRAPRSSIAAVAIAEVFYDALGLAALAVIGAVFTADVRSSLVLVVVVIASALPWTRRFASLLFCFLLNLAGRLALNRSVVIEEASFRNAFSFSRYIMAVAMSVLAWTMPAIYFCTLDGAGESLNSFFEKTRAVSEGTLYGVAVGAPGGVGTSGTMIRLRYKDISQVSLEPEVSLVYRAGTYWLSLVFGAFFLTYLGVSRARSGQTESSHFDTIADEYDDCLPQFWNDKMLEKKSERMLAIVRKHCEAPSRGLDLGCGHGHYARWFEDRGVAIVASDYSYGQTSWAAKKVKEVTVADGTHLPFKGESFDFVYSTNVIHHLRDRNAQVAAVEEIRRVLKPSGVFILNEINTKNPLFRFYAGYVYPVLRAIDTGEEWWIHPDRWEPMNGWRPENVDYYSFLPDFLPNFGHRLLGPVETYLESSKLRELSAHYTAVFCNAEGRDTTVQTVDTRDVLTSEAP